MVDKVDFKDSEFQAILDIKPVKVVSKETNVTKVEPIADEKVDIINFPRDIFDYFHFPHPKNCLPEIISDVRMIAERIKSESEDNNDFFKVLQAIEKQLPKSNDNIKRLNNIIYFLNAVKKGNLKETLKDTLYDMDILAEEGKNTGNWSNYLRMAEKKENEIRNHNRE